MPPASSTVWIYTDVLAEIYVAKRLLVKTKSMPRFQHSLEVLEFDT